MLIMLMHGWQRPCCLMTRETHRTIQCYNTALQIDPNLALAWDNKAWALCNSEKYDESIQC